MAKYLDEGFEKLGVFLIHKAFSEHHYLVRKRFADFHVRTFLPSKKSMLGQYNALNHTIALYGTGNRAKRDIVITFLHELSHHIETMQVGRSGHQKSFYDIHKKLLETAVDYNIITIDDITTKSMQDASNSKKLAKMFQNYKKKPIPEGSAMPNVFFLSALRDEPLVDEVVRIRCQKSDANIFSSRGYVWNNTRFVWSKRFQEYNSLRQEEDWLKSIGLSPYNKDDVVYWTKYITLIVEGDTYTWKEALKDMGFLYNSEQKQWTKQTTLEEAKLDIKMLKTLRGISAYGVMM